MRVLVTGGAGFIGSALVRRLLAAGDQVVTLDALTYAGRRENLEAVEGLGDHDFVHGDVCDPGSVARALEAGPCDAVLHLAAETHVDRSLEDDGPFVRTNVEGTRVVLEGARARDVRVVVASTDEVYGGLPRPDPQGPAPNPFTPDSPLRPTSPYAATKAAADLLALAAHRSHGQDVVVVRATNTYGPRQHPEKLVPVAITAALEGRPVPLYGDGLQRRDWLWVEDHVDGLVAALERGRAGSVYHLAGEEERTNLEVVRTVLGELDAPADAVVRVRDRPGHDQRYALETDGTARDLEWSPGTPLRAGLRRTVAWYREHRGWWEDVPDLGRRRG